MAKFNKMTAVVIMLSVDTAQLGLLFMNMNRVICMFITGSQKYANCGLNLLAMLFCHQDYSTSSWYTCLRGTAQLCSEILCAERISILAFQHANMT